MVGAKQTEILMNSAKQVEDDLSIIARQPVKEKKSGPSFSAVLADETKDETSKEAKPKNENKQEAKKEARAKEDAKRLLEAKMAGPVSELSPMYQYLYYFIYKDPATLSMAERQSLHPQLGLNNNSVKGLGIVEFQKLLSSYGVKINDFSFYQIADLIRMNSKEEVTGFLERFRMEMRENKPDQNDTLEDENSGNRYGYASMQNPVLVAIEEHRRSLDKEKRTQIQIAENLLSNVKGAGINNLLGAGSLKGTQTFEQSNDISPEEFVTQVLDAIAAKKPEELSKIVIKLHPEHLGSLQLTVELNRKNQMEARFEAETEKAKSLIETNVSELEKGLYRQGVAVNKIKVVKKPIKRGVGA